MEEKQTFIEAIEAEIKDCRFTCDTFSLMVKRFRRHESILNWTCAIVSLGSLGVWTQFECLGKFCGGLIVISQIIEALKPQMPFSKNVHLLNSKCYRHELIYLEFVNLWRNYKDGIVNEKQARTTFDQLKIRQTNNEDFDDDANFEPTKKEIEEARVMTQKTLKAKLNLQ